MATISRAHIEQMFLGMKEEAGWNTSAELLWGYFFMAPSREQLLVIQRRLEGEGYQFVELHQPQSDLFVLHLEIAEIHSPDTLLQRNAELETLASQHGVEHDGMDAGPVSPEPSRPVKKPWWQFW
jgi:hypothetical protein